MPASSGPYRLVRRDAGRLELTANPHWHGGRPRYPEVAMVVIRDDNTRALRMLAGAGDLALNAVPPLLVPLFEGQQGFAVRSAPGVGTTYLGINTEAAALRDVRVRQALAHAIDREALVRAKLGGRAQLARGFVVPGHWAFSESVPSYAFDPPRARLLLQQAGLTARAGEPLLRLSLRCGSDRFRPSIARALAAMLRDVGIDVEIRPSEVASLFADLNRGRFELTMLQVPEVVEPHVLHWFFGSDRVPGEGNEGANRWRMRSRALDRALEAGRATTVRAESRAAYVRAQTILARQLPIVALWHEDVVAVTDERAADFAVPRLGRFDTLAR
jgi:peptide/nickel transport system substrate-binding protein